MGRKGKEGRTVALKLTKRQEEWFDKISSTPYGKLADAQILSHLIDNAMNKE